MTLPRAAEKRATGERAAALVAGWRARGETVVLASGVFDLPDAGHARRLAAARELADRLIVAVHGDAAAAAREGPGGPVLDAAHRATLVAALRVVDLVVVVEEDSLEPLLAAIVPDLFVAERDERPERVPDATRVVVPDESGAAAGVPLRTARRLTIRERLSGR